MTAELLLRWLHVTGGMVLFGTGIGIAFFMLLAHRSGRPAVIAHTAHVVVIADMIFTATAAIFQPVTGVLLAQQTGWPLTEPWILVSVALYVFVGLFWLPVVWIQIRLRNLARQSENDCEPLSQGYFRLFHLWFLCGIPAFSAMLAIIWLMLARPALW